MGFLEKESIRWGEWPEQGFGTASPLWEAEGGGAVQGWSWPAPLVREEQEAGEDAIRALGPHHAIVVVDRQPHLLAHWKPQQHTT